MDFIVTIFNEALYRPLFNALIWIYNIIPGNDLGIAIILLTVLIRFILYPLSKKAIQSQKAINVLQPKIKEIQKKYKNKEEQAKIMMELYKTHKVNPMAGCLPILVQLPILIALYRVFFSGLNPETLNILYSFVQRPETINPIFLGLNLDEKSVPLAIVVGIVFFIQTKLSMPKKDKQKAQTKKSAFGEMFQKQMLYLFPIFIVFILLRLPSALGLYLLVGGIFMAFQQYLTKKKYYSEKNV